jgi:hypothetical protein
LVRRGGFIAKDSASVGGKLLKLAIANKFALPVDTVTQSIAVLAKKRSGKSYLGRRLAEQLFYAKQQIVIVDPKGDWWGIRSSADGKSPGLPVVIFGGERGDVPLEVGGGEMVANLVVKERVSALLDLSLLRKGNRHTFLEAFLETLYRLKAHEIYRTPMMLFLDEGHIPAPQKPQKGEERMLGATDDVVRLGGQRGIGCVLLTQRPASINKNVLTQSQMLIALRTIAPQDLAALKAWIDVHGTAEQGKQMMESLPSLPTGDAWFWSPGWPTDEGIFHREHVLPIDTYDSMATPKPGEKRKEPKSLADVDLDAVRQQMSETIERAKADNPKELRKRIAELEKQLKAKVPAPRPTVEKVTKTEIKRVEVPVLKEADLKRLEAVRGAVQKLAKRTEEQFAKTIADVRGLYDKTVAIEALAQTAANRAEKSYTALRTTPAPQPTQTRPSVAAPQLVTRTAPALTAAPGPPITGKGELKILTAIAQHGDGVTREQLTVLTGYKASSRNTYLQRLRQAGLIEEVGEWIRVTEAGLATLPSDFEPLPTGDALRAHWLTPGTLPEGERAILALLCKAHPNSVPRESISEETGYKRSSRDTYLQRLRSRKLVVDAGQGEVIASDNLF